MNNKFSKVSTNLVKGLVNTSVDYWKAKLIVKEEYEDALHFFETVNPVLELADALEMDLLEDIWPKIKAVLKDEITKEECTRRILNDYEEFFTERLIKREEKLERTFFDMNHDIKDGLFNMSPNGLIGKVEQVNRYTWNVKFYNEDEEAVEPKDSAKNNFKTKLEAMEYILQIAETHNIIEVRV